MKEGMVATMSEAQALTEIVRAGCPDWTRHNEDRPGHLTVRELCVLADMIGNDYVCRQVLRGERVIKTVLLNPTRGKVIGGLLEEVGDLIELPAASSFDVREKFKENRDGEVPIAFVHGLAVEDFLELKEHDIPAAILKQGRMLKRSTDELVRTALGDKNLRNIRHAGVWAAHTFFFLKTVANVHECYHFHVVGVSGKPLSLHIWHDDGWHIEVLPVPYPRELEIGDFVVSP